MKNPIKKFVALAVVALAAFGTAFANQWDTDITVDNVMQCQYLGKMPAKEVYALLDQAEYLVAGFEQGTEGAAYVDDFWAFDDSDADDEDLEAMDVAEEYILAEYGDSITNTDTFMTFVVRGVYDDGENMDGWLIVSNYSAKTKTFARVAIYMDIYFY